MRDKLQEGLKNLIKTKISDSDSIIPMEPKFVNDLLFHLSNELETDIQSFFRFNLNLKTQGRDLNSCFEFQLGQTDYISFEPREEP